MTVDATNLERYKMHLYEQERSRNTVEKYTRDIGKFLHFLADNPWSKHQVCQFKEYLLTLYAPSSVNSILAAVNGFLEWLGHGDCRVKPLKIQKVIFAQPEQELSRGEYERLVQVAERKGQRKLSLLIQTICATGIRVSELSHITVSALHIGRANVSCKGKNRVIFLPNALCKLLKAYCKEKHIDHGSVFVTKTGQPMDRSNIWRMMKRLCKGAKVPANKVFPHNLRHLFARTYYQIEKDISRLADILGHSSVETTRIYTMESGSKHARQLERMNLVCTHKLKTT